jgi:penicillin-binding protein-related factor A (putative recombinase)
MSGRGTGLEILIARSAKRQEDQGLHLQRAGVRFIPGGAIGPRGLTAGRVCSAGGPDFQGDYQARAVLIEAKASASASRFELKNIREHQAVILKRAHARGCLAFFLVELAAGTPAPRYFALTWPVLAPWWEAYAHDRAGYGPKAPSSIPVAVLEREALQVRRDRHGLQLVEALQALACSSSALA